jgi:FtsH-binding integral membrane protein
MQATAVVSELPQERRHEFIRQTYTHVTGTIGLFSFVSWILFQTGVGETFFWIIEENPMLWLAVLGVFAGFGWLTSRLAEAQSMQSQYLGLGVAAGAEALIFSPLLYGVYEYSGFAAVQGAAMGTVALVISITVVVGASKHEFSYLRGILNVTSLVALAFIVASIVFGFSLGLLFSYIMIALAGGFIVYDTSRVLNEHTEDTYVTAALELFSSMALMFWYMLQIFDKE